MKTKYLKYALISLNLICMSVFSQDTVTNTNTFNINVDNNITNCNQVIGGGDSDQGGCSGCGKGCKDGVIEVDFNTTFTFSGEIAQLLEELTRGAVGINLQIAPIVFLPNGKLCMGNTQSNTITPSSVTGNIEENIFEIIQSFNCNVECNKRYQVGYNVRINFLIDPFLLQGGGMQLLAQTTPTPFSSLFEQFYDVVSLDSIRCNCGKSVRLPAPDLFAFDLEILYDYLVEVFDLIGGLPGRELPASVPALEYNIVQDLVVCCSPPCECCGCCDLDNCCGFSCD